MKNLPIALALVAALAIPAFAEDKPKEAPKETPKAELDAKAPAIVIQDMQGRSFELHDAGIEKKDAVAVVMAKAKEYGAAKDAKAETKIADLKGVLDDGGELDATKVAELANACGEYFGLVATDETAEEFKSLNDLITWITEASNAPILFLTFSPRCGSVKRQCDAIVEMVAKNKIRAFALACNTKDTDEHMKSFVDSMDWPIRTFWDRDQRVTDMLGAKVTPHFFLFDKDGVLRYRGGMSNDPMGFMDEADRKDYLVNAATAIRAGKDVTEKESEPSG